LPRAKSTVAAHKRHKKLLELVKGHRGLRRNTVRNGHQSMMHALAYAFEHRRERKGDMRRMWITRINAASRQQGMNYSDLMVGLKKSGVIIDRKMLAEMAVNDSAAFANLVTTAKAQAKA
jgi:large subunit ribosomal protein L20